MNVYKSLTNIIKKVNMTNTEMTRNNIDLMTRKFILGGGKINKVPYSKSQEYLIRKTHSFSSGRTGWFEVK